MTIYTRASAVAAAIVLATVMLGCSNSTGPNPVTPTQPPTPTAPPTPLPPTPVILYTLSGVVFEVTSAGKTPIEGVVVYCDRCGPPEGHSTRFSDANGAYSFDAVLYGTTPLWIAKRGYVLPDQPDQSGPNGDSYMGELVVSVTGDTRYDIQIIRK